jgi:hypothetical protein
MAQAIPRRMMFAMAAAALLGAATAAVAQQGPGPMGPGRGMMGGGPGMMGGAWDTGSYLDRLKTELGITAGQQGAWHDYAETVTGVQQQMQGLHQSMFESMGTASWQERRDLMNQMFEARRQAFDTVHDAALKLSAALDPAQQKQAQGILPGLGFGPGMMGGGPAPR